MNKINRNDPCPCGSGKKFKKCCGAEKSSPLKGLSPGIRMKSGVRYDPEADGFYAIVHTWDNIHCLGEPKEWFYPEVFQTEDEALRYYKTYIRPGVQKMIADIESKSSSGTFFHQELE